MAARAISQAEREATSERMKAWWADPANKAKIAERQRERMRNDSAYREATFGKMTSSEGKRRCAEAVREWWTDPEKRGERTQKRAEIAKASWANPNHRAARMAAIAVANATPQAKANRSAGARIARAKRAKRKCELDDAPIVRRIPKSRARPIPLDPFEIALFGVKR